MELLINYEVLTFKSAEEMSWCSSSQSNKTSWVELGNIHFFFLGFYQKNDHPNENLWVVLSCGSVCYAIQRGLTFQSVNEIL